MNVYLGTFLVSFAALALEITLTRLLSVATWYHLAFFAVSCAMLGMTAGSVTVYLRPNWFQEERLNDRLALVSLGYALAIPLALVALCLIPLHLAKSVMSLAALVAATLACALPFYFSGMSITAVLTKHQLPIGKLYGCDLVGASLGCLFVLGALEVLDAPSLILLMGAIAVLAALSFAWGSPSFKHRRLGRGILSVLVLLTIVNSSTSYGIRPFVVKGHFEDAESYLSEEWNSFSRVVVQKLSRAKPQYWGASPVAPTDERVYQYKMTIDGEAASTLRRFTNVDDIDHLRFDVTNVAYHLRPRGGACIIGAGAGRDVQSAILFGHEKIVGIELNPIFVRLLEGRFREFAGIADRDEVTLVVDEARSYLSRTEEKHSVIQMALVDTWAATGAGAFTLSENTLYTVEAWATFLSRLSGDGIFTVSRWYDPENPGETGRVVSLAVATLLGAGVTDPSQHIAMVSAGRIATLLLSRQPFSPPDVEKLREVSTGLRFDLAILPGVPPAIDVLGRIVSAKSMAELHTAIADEPLNYEPTTDENPYFFNMLRLKHIRPIFWQKAGQTRGNLIATVTLVGLILSLLLLCLATIVFPLALNPRREKRGQDGEGVDWSGAAYFSLIGAGFMFTEIALVQRLSVFLGHPVYALGVLLFTVIAAAGCGSLLSERLPLTRRPWVFVYPVVVSLAVAATRFLLPFLGSTMMSASTVAKIVASVLLIAPLGMLLGLCFPTGMRLVRSVRAAETPWYSALNGVFGVLCSALAVFVSINFGISTSFYIAAACYAMLLVCLPGLYNASRNQCATLAPVREEETQGRPT